MTPACRECLRAQDKARYADAETAQRRKDYAKTYYSANTERLLALRRENHQRHRLAALRAYGGKVPCCACCGESNEAFLTIDHINGDGAEHRRSLGEGAGSLQVWRALAAAGFPGGYQVLCWNCNAAKHIHGVCPH